jgi:DNA modification methylase
MIDYRIGDTRDLTADLPDGSVHLVASSPPFVALRSYLPADHPDKHREIGSEPDPASFIDTLLGLTAEWGRVLAPWGSIAIELGDTYAGSGGAGGDYNDGGLREGQQQFSGSAATMRESWRQKNAAAAEWPRPKCLALIPQAYALSLAYGRNVLTGEPSPAGQWLVRNVIVWHRPNPAVGALGDKFRPSTSYIVVATRSAKRWFDLTAVRTTESTDLRKHKVVGAQASDRHDVPAERGSIRSPYAAGATAGAPPLDAWTDHETWTITTQPSSLAHYAMWPPKLAERLVLSMCPEWVCRVCGEPRRRVEGAAEYVKPDGSGHRFNGDAFVGDLTLGNRRAITGADNGNMTAIRPTLGWTDCGHDDYAPGVTLDPFAGTATTLCVADLHNRTGIGFDIDHKNAELVQARRQEVSRALFGTKPEVPGQMEMML